MSSVIEECPSQNLTYLQMEMDTFRPEYAELFVSNDNILKQYIRKSLIDLNGRKLVSSAKFRSLFIRPGMNSLGPCISDGVFDYAIGLRGKTWPCSARERIEDRNEKKWLSDSLVKDLVSDGCTYVPVRPRNSNQYDRLWRISFALSEKRLMSRMNYTQMLCYALLKITLKELINKTESTAELLCSYFLKTCLFWLIEETDNEDCIWNVTNLFSCFRLCMNKIIEWVDKCYCPNFFIPHNNMFIGRIHDGNKASLLLLLQSIQENGYKSLLKCESFREHALCTKVTEIEREANLDIFLQSHAHISV